MDASRECAAWWLQENVTLIKEINDLRRELGLSRTRVHDLEAALGVHRNNNNNNNAGGGGGAGAARAAFPAAAAGDVGTNAAMQLQLDEKAKIVELQRTEIVRLRGLLMDLERPASAADAAVVNSRPSSAARLPPMTVGAQ